MRKISAENIVTMTGEVIKDGVVVIDDGGKIVELGVSSNYDKKELEHYEGTIIPGFVNCHCHLELSFMKDKIDTGTGLPEFVTQVVTIRDQFSEEEQKTAIASAEEQMMAAGIVAVGDISNDTRSFFRKEMGHLRYHTFVELFDMNPAITNQSTENGIKVFDAIPKVNGGTGSITPHAPYTCTPDLFKWCDFFSSTKGAGILSIHNQEQLDENTMFINNTGVWPALFKAWGVDYSWFQPTGENSLASVARHLKKNNRVLFIHNTNTDLVDIGAANELLGEVSWCFCPNANLFIENSLPNYKVFLDTNAHCVLGTDSLASNWQLSILEEIKTIHRFASYVPLKELFQWGTINGAKTLGYDSDLGTIEMGKTPGLVQIEGLTITEEEWQLSPNSSARRIDI